MKIKLNGDEIGELVKEAIEQKYAKPGSTVTVDVPYISGGVTVEITAPPKVVEPAPQ